MINEDLRLAADRLYYKLLRDESTTKVTPEGFASWVAFFVQEALETRDWRLKEKWEKENKDE